MSTNGGDTWSQLTTDGHVSVLVLDPVTTTTLYLGTYADGIVKSLDKGHGWDLKSNGLAGSYTTGIVQNPSIATTIYAADNGKGVYKSTNGGGSWSSANTGLSDKTVLCLAIDPVTPSTLYAGSGGGVFRSKDSGDNWSLVGNILIPGVFDFVRVMAIDPSVTSTIYAATDLGVFKSLNGGDSWNEVSTAFADVSIHALVVDPHDSRIVYAGTQQGVFKSTNGGLDWNQRYLGMKDPSLYLYVFSIAIDPVDTGTIYAASERGIFKSTNGGDSWISTSENSWMSAIVIDPTNRNTLYASTGRSFWVSANSGGSWYSIQTNWIDGFGLSSLAISSTNPTTIYAGAEGGGVYSMDLANATTTVAKPRGAAYVSAQDVSLYTNKPASIYYTTDGSDPTTSPTKQVYSDSIRISSNTTLKFYGVDSNGTGGPQGVANYVIDTAPPITTPTPKAAIYTSSQSISLVCSDGTGSGCAATYYCLGSGCTPITVHSGPIPISSTTDLRYYSTDSAGNREAIKTSRFIFGEQLEGSLTVSIAGFGSVHGTSTLGENYSCASGFCPATQYAYGDEVILMATDSADYHFAGWSGACTATSGACVLTMTTDRSVTASFSLVAPVRLYNQSGSRDYGSLADAYAAIADNTGGTIDCRELSLAGGLRLDRPVALLLKGGYDSVYGSNTSRLTVLQGGLTVRQGSLKIENMVLR